MTQMHAGLICTLLLIGTMAGMFGCMSAARCRRYFAFALCLGLTALDAALLVAPLSSPPGALSPAPWTASALLLVALGIWISRKLFLASRRQISPVSIKESSDHLPCALCFAWENGQPCLKNYIMDELSHLLTAKRCSMRMRSGRPLRMSPSSRFQMARHGALSGRGWRCPGKAFTRSPARTSPRKHGFSGSWKRTTCG